MGRHYPFFIVPLLLALFGGEERDVSPKIPPAKIAQKQAEDRAVNTAKDRRTFKDRPNIIFILTDDQDSASLQAMPRLRRSFPLVLQNHILTDPVCCPSRETFMTGQYAHNHGVRSNSRQVGMIRNNREWGGWWAAGSRQENIGRWLQRSGYRTSLIGKYLNGFNAKRNPPRGWDDTFLALDDKAKGYFNYRMLDQGEIKKYGEKARDYSPTVMTTRAIENVWQSKEAGKPLFLFLSYNTPHNGTTSSRRPYYDPEPHPRDRSAPLEIPDISAQANFNHRDPLKARYMDFAKKIAPWKEDKLQHRLRSRWLSLYSLDQEIARLVKAVRASGEEDNTYFFFTTDNGFFLGNHRLVGKFLPYDEATRFPLLVKGPGVVPGKRDDLIGNIDFVPTVLSLAKAKAPTGHIIDGKILTPLLRGKSIPWRQEIVMETFPTKNFEEEKGPHQPYVAVRSNRDVFIRYQKNGLWPTTWNGEEEYYDLTRDPSQLHNVVDDPRYQGRIEELRQKTNLWKNCSGRQCP